MTHINLEALVQSIRRALKEIQARDLSALDKNTYESIRRYLEDADNALGEAWDILDNS